MIDFLDIWSRQKDFQKHFYNPDSMTEEEKISLTKEYILCMHRELGEVLNVIPWKKHRLNQKEYDVGHLQEELIDCFKYLLNVCIIHGMSPDSFNALFFKKSAIVEQRYEDEILQTTKQPELPFGKKDD